MKKLIIDPEFQKKIPPLTEDEYKQLEENIVADGEIYEPIIVWHGTIVDGHNRYRIACDHPEIPFRTKEMDFNDKWDAFNWMYKKQLGRRNLTEQQRDYLIGKMYEARKNRHGASDGFRGNQHTKVVSAQNEHLPHGRIGEQIGKELGIGNGTVRRAYDFSRGVDAIRDVNQEASEKVLNGQAKVTKAEIQNFTKLPDEEKKDIVQNILENKPAKRESQKAIKERNDNIEKAIAQLYSDDSPQYTLDSLVEDVSENCKSFARAIELLVESRKEVITCISDKQKIVNCLNTIVTELSGFLRRV